MTQLQKTRRELLCSAAGFAGAMKLAGASAAIARPTPQQVAWQAMELEMFIHFAPNTWQDREYDDHSTPLDRINPEKLDTAQWVDVAEAMGAKQIIFVAKHTGGFCWWPTETSKYGVKETPWRGSKGDLMRELSNSCRKRSMRMGVYLSPQDRFHGVAVGGRAKTEDAQRRYSEVYRQQLTELLSRYGTMEEVWFDGSLVVDVGDILARWAPKAMVFQSRYATIRWVGNEEGVCPYPAWNAVSEAAARSGVATAKDSDPNGTNWLPIEVDARMRNTWFWNTRNEGALKSVEQLLGMYYRSAGHGAVLLLNHTPDPTGRIPEPDARRAREFGEEIRRRFGTSAAQTSGKGTTLEMRIKGSAPVDHVITAEDIRQGERVRGYVIEGLSGGEWKELARGSAIGNKKIDAFAPGRMERLRIRVTESAGTPVLRQFAAFSTGQGAVVQAATSYRFDVIKQWKPDSLQGEWTAWDMDITAFVKDAGQYEVDFINIGGSTGIQIQSLKLVSGGVEAAEFVRPGGRANTFHVNITGLGERLVLRALVRGRRGNDSYGQVFLRRLP